jgi:hypothetical protein
MLPPAFAGVMAFDAAFLGFHAKALHPRLYAAARVRGLRTRQNAGNGKFDCIPLAQSQTELGLYYGYTSCGELTVRRAPNQVNA